MAICSHFGSVTQPNKAYAQLNKASVHDRTRPWFFFLLLKPGGRPRWTRGCCADVSSANSGEPFTGPTLEFFGKKPDSEAQALYGD